MLGRGLEVTLVKKRLYLLLALGLLLSALSLVSCKDGGGGGDPGPSKIEEL